MRVFTRTTKVLGLTTHELEALADMVSEASHTGKAERAMSPTQTLAIEVDDMYKHASYPKYK